MQNHKHKESRHQRLDNEDQFVSSVNQISRSIPLPRSHVTRTESELLLLEGQQIAEQKDIDMYYRLLTGIRRSQKRDVVDVRLDDVHSLPVHRNPTVLVSGRNSYHVANQQHSIRMANMTGGSRDKAAAASYPDQSTAAFSAAQSAFDACNNDISVQGDRPLNSGGGAAEWSITGSFDEAPHMFHQGPGSDHEGIFKLDL